MHGEGRIAGEELAQRERRLCKMGKAKAVLEARDLARAEQAAARRASNEPKVRGAKQKPPRSRAGTWVRELGGIRGGANRAATVRDPPLRIMKQGTTKAFEHTYSPRGRGGRQHAVWSLRAPAFRRAGNDKRQRRPQGRRMADPA